MMTDQHPGDDPTRVERPVTDPTQAMPAAAGGPPAYGPPGGPPPGDDRDPRRWILYGLLGLVVLLGLIVLAVQAGGDDEAAEDTTTTSGLEETTTTSSSTTSSTTTTTAAPTSTTSTTSPPVTVAPVLCTSGEPDDPDHGVEVLYEAYRIRDRDCADRLGTKSAIDTLWAIPGSGGGWTYQGCTEEEVPDPHLDCAYSFTGGSTHFRLVHSEIDGWVVYEVYQNAD